MYNYYNAPTIVDYSSPKLNGDEQMRIIEPKYKTIYNYNYTDGYVYNTRE